MPFKKGSTVLAFLSRIYAPLHRSAAHVDASVRNQPFENRRTFLGRVVQFFSVAIAALIVTPVFRFVSGSRSGAADDGWRDIAVVSDLPAGEVTQVTYNKLVRDGWMSSMAQATVFVNKSKDGRCIVFDPHCTHLGCEVAWNEGNSRFLCPCHGGKYDAAGNRIAGPPPRPLRQYETRIASGILSIGKLRG
jgi:menaquinol-cytochrome c reductase iron-sulfur subunit